MDEPSTSRAVEPDQPGFWTSGRVALALGFLGFLAVALTIADPGITIDEPLDVRPGRTYISTLQSKGPARFLDRATVDFVFRDNAEHPPLGRWLLGIASTLGEPLETALRGSPDPVRLYIVSGRMAPALVFGAMVWLVSATTGSRYGRAAGLVAGLSLAIMPRVFAHAHLAALDTFIAFFWTLGLLSSVRAIASRRPVLGMGFAGLLFGLALLTKIHAWFLPPIVLSWALIRLRPGRALAAWSIWLAVGLATFFVGWPWLWYDPIGRLRAYLGTGVERISIQVLYFGQVYADRDVPWHYPWVYFLATVPVGLLALGAWGLVQGWRGRRIDPFPLLLAGTIGFFLILFSTKVPIYDGERLFLVAFPLVAILIGRGFADLWRQAGRRWRVGLVALVVGQGFGVVMIHPFGLSYYNLLVGGLPGAELLGLELTYWGDAVDGPLLDELATLAKPGETAALAPTLAPEQGKVVTTRRLVHIPIVLADQDLASRADWLVISRRSSYWTPEVRDRIARDPMIATEKRQGVWLSAVIGRRKSGFP
jgi:4-amino-4-deoxy-L-arabinose transferase-like glycosyltransferase